VAFFCDTRNLEFEIKSYFIYRKEILMPLISERLIYHKITKAEFGGYMSWYTNDAVMKHINGKGLTIPEAQHRFTKALEINQLFPELGFYAVKDILDNTFVGIAKLVYTKEEEAEVGYGTLPQFWGKGYASEMLESLIHYSKEISTIKELIAVVNQENIASKRVLEKQGFNLYKSDFENKKPVQYYKLFL